MPCPCGCLGLVKPGNTYATRTCAALAKLRAQSKAELAAQRRAVWARMAAERRKRSIQPAIKARRVMNFQGLLGRLLERAVDHGEVRAALYEAYRTGYTAGWTAHRRRVMEQAS